jgi:hypothetical protein
MAATPRSIRFSPDLRERVAARAAADHRSFSGEVLALVEKGLTAETAAALSPHEVAVLIGLVEHLDATIETP